MNPAQEVACAPPLRGGRVAFFGGSFDPPHLGHLAVARAAREALDLDAVLFAPVGLQPLKPRGATAGFEDRLRMTQLAVAGEPGFEVSLIDAPRPGNAPNYTLESLQRLRSELPAAAQLFCLMGADSFFALRSWHRAAEIPFAAALIVASRPGLPLRDLEAALPAGLTLAGCKACRKSGHELRRCRLSDAGGRRAPFFLLPGLHVEISASEVRSQLGAGPRAADLLPPAVRDYIAQHGLYTRA
jgi:nicotinate-nucleotide adenylyltransferase